MQIQQGEILLANKFISNHLDRLLEWSIGDIKKCCRMNYDGTCEANGSLIGSFLLWCCTLDFMGGIYTGRATARETSRRYKDFISTYMKRYDFEKLVELRWALVHFYTSRNFAFHQSNDISECKRIHLSQLKNGIVLDLYSCISDLEKAAELYKIDLQNSDELKIRLYRYFKTSSPIVPLFIEYDQSETLATGATTSSNTARTATFE